MQHLVLKLKTGSLARNILKIFEKALLDKITIQFPLLNWNQSEVPGHECIGILSEPNIQWMEHPLSHCPARLSEFNLSWVTFLKRTWECCKNLQTQFFGFLLLLLGFLLIKSRMFFLLALKKEGRRVPFQSQLGEQLDDLSVSEESNALILRHYKIPDLPH